MSSDAAADAALVDVERAPARRSGRRGTLHTRSPRPVAEHGDEAAAERGHDALAQLAVADRLAAVGVDHLLDEVVLDDVRAAGLVGRTRTS